MKKINKIISFIFIIALCFFIKTDVFAVTTPELRISRYDYDFHDKVAEEASNSFDMSFNSNTRLYAVVAYGNDIATDEVPVGTFVQSGQLDDVAWTSSNTSVATIDATGKVHAVATGTTTITAKYMDSTLQRQLTATKTITVYGTSACNPGAIHDYTYRLYFSTGLPTGPEPVELKKVIVGNTSDQTANYTLPTPTKEGYTFGGWYAVRNHLEEEKVNDLIDVDWDFNYLNTSTPCQSYVQTGTIYAKWIPISGQGATPTDVDADTDQTVKVDDTAMGSSLYIIAISVLLLTFGTLMIIISLKDNKVKTQ